MSVFLAAWEQRKLGEVIISEHKGKVKSIMKGGNTNYLETNYLNGGTTQKVDAIADVSKDDVLILWDGSKAGQIHSMLKLMKSLHLSFTYVSSRMLRFKTHHFGCNVVFGMQAFVQLTM